MDPVFWLGLSILLVAVSLTAVLITLLPAVWELARAARSAEKLFDTLSRELPPTLEAIRLTGLEITDLTDDVSDGVQSAGHLVRQVDQSLDSARHQIQQVNVNTRSTVSGFRAAWRVFFQKPPSQTGSRTSRYPASDPSNSMSSDPPDSAWRSGQPSPVESHDAPIHESVNNQEIQSRNAPAKRADYIGY